MRGLVSLALAIALPAALSNEFVTESFPFRDLIIFLVIITILFTLLVQGLTLPWLIRSLDVEKDEAFLSRQTTDIYYYLTKQSIEYIKNLHFDEHYSTAVKRLLDGYYNNRLQQSEITAKAEPEDPAIIAEAEKLLSKLLEHERRLLHDMRGKDTISEEVYIRILSKIDRDEVSFAP